LDDPEVFFRLDDITSPDSEASGYDSGWYSALPIDMDKLSAYIQPVINYRVSEEGQTTYVS
jgi:hypothetical protein